VHASVVTGRSLGTTEIQIQSSTVELPLRQQKQCHFIKTVFAMDSDPSSSFSSGRADDVGYLDQKKRSVYTTEHQEAMAALVVRREGDRAPGSDSFWTALESVRVFLHSTNHLLFCVHLKVLHMNVAVEYSLARIE
jgi:hypothetical protein